MLRLSAHTPSGTRPATACPALSPRNRHPAQGRRWNRLTDRPVAGVDCRAHGWPLAARDGHHRQTETGAGPVEPGSLITMHVGRRLETGDHAVLAACACRRGGRAVRRHVVTKTSYNPNHRQNCLATGHESHVASGLIRIVTVSDALHDNGLTEGEDGLLRPRVMFPDSD